MTVNAVNSIHAVAQAVLHSTWQATLLSFVVLGILFCVGRQLRASWRFALWLVVIARLAMPWMPAASWSLYSFVPTWERNQAAKINDASTSDQIPVVSFDQLTRLDDLEVEVDQPRRTSSPKTTIDLYTSPRSSQFSPPIEQRMVKPLLSWTDWLSLVWSVFATALIVRLFVQHWLLAHRSASWSPIRGSPIESVFSQCLSEMRIRRRVTVLLSDDQTGPATCGVFRPKIVLPIAMAETLTHQELRLIFLHELIHIRRFDTLTDLFASIVTVVHWFNPFAWFALASLRRERELTCDAATLDFVGPNLRKDYGQVLLRAVESLQSTTSRAGTVAMFGGRMFVNPLENRIRSVTSYRQATMSAHLAGALLLALIVGTGLTDAIAKDPGKPTIANRDAKAPKTFAISGTCTDEAGKPLSNVRVRLFRTDNLQEARIEPLREMTTNVAGQFRFENVEVLSFDEEIRVNYTCVLDAPGRATQTIYVRRMDRDHVQSVRMNPAAELTGRVTDTNGKPIVGARVWIPLGVVGEFVEGVMSATTDANGRYVIRDATVVDADKDEFIKFGEANEGTSISFSWASIVICARHPNYVKIVSTYTRAPSTVDFKLPDGGSLEGQVVDATSKKPVADVLVKVRPALSNRGDLNQPYEDNSREGKTDYQGKYRFTGLGATSYTISAQSPDQTCTAIELGTLAVNKVHRAPDLELISGAIIEGQVIDEDGRPVVYQNQRGSRIAIELRGPSISKNGDNREYHSVNDEGRFRIRVAPGQNQVSINADPSLLPIEKANQQVEIAAGETRQIVFRVLKHAPPVKHDIPADELPMPVASEQPAANAILDLGGCYKLDDEDHVVEVNMVYYITKKGRRLENEHTSDKSLILLSNFPRLKSLALKDSQATDEGFKFVGKLPQLESLHVWDAKSISDVGVKQLANLTTLKTVYLWNCRVTDEAIKDLATIASLEEIIISSDSLTDSAFKYATRSPKLKWLDIRGKLPFTDQAAQYVAQMPALERLTLNAAITNNGLREIHRARNLKFLDLYSEKITADAVLELQKAVPDLKVSALSRQFPSHNALRDAADPRRQQINREEGMKGLEQIKMFLALMSRDESDQAATLCRSFMCSEPEPDSPEAALEPEEYSAGPAVVKQLKHEISSFAGCSILMAYGDTKEVIAITTAFHPEIGYRKGSDGRRQEVKRPIVLRAVMSHGKWYVAPDSIAGSDDPQWRIDYFLGDHAGAQKLLPM